ncbi:MAG: NADH:ubiquinone oxidoreductase subunit [Jatrophihabitantaceae bacterium]|nr:NADH:ubiquinone oxidoreductase subunit [Jatrophihabitantaceae bacterium]
MIALAAPLETITSPSIAYGALLPVLIVLVAALASVLVEAGVSRESRYVVQMALTVGSLLAALLAVIVKRDERVVTAAGAISVDGVSLFLWGTILSMAILCVLLIGERSVDTGSAVVAQAAVVAGSSGDRRMATSTRIQTEIFPLTLFAVTGMMIFPASNNLLLMFVALEVLSLPLYLMCGLARRRRLLSQEAAVKYFLLGAFASAFFLYGLALIYGYANSVDLPVVLASASASGKSDVLLYLGLGMLLIGLLFKAGIAPFHTWTPDVYQGAPTPVTAFMASCTKVAAFGAIARVLYVGFNSTQWDWRPIVWGAAIASMVVGSVLGLTQTDLKRLLAYSSIAHAGFILVGVIAMSEEGLASMMFYLVTYGFTTIAAFGLITLVRTGDGEATQMAQWAGMAKKSPLIAGTMTILLLAMAGIPLTSGFTGKFFVFRAAYHDAGPLVVIALLASAVAAFFYLRIIVVMFFAEPQVDGPTIAVPSALTTIALTIGVAVTIVLGVAPQPIIDLAQKAATFYA